MTTHEEQCTQLRASLRTSRQRVHILARRVAQQDQEMARLRDLAHTQAAAVEGRDLLIATLTAEQQRLRADLEYLRSRLARER